DAAAARSEERAETRAETRAGDRGPLPAGAGRLSAYPALWSYTRELFQLPAFTRTTAPASIGAGPDLAEAWRRPGDRKPRVDQDTGVDPGTGVDPDTRVEQTRVEQTRVAQKRGQDS